MGSWRAGWRPTDETWFFDFFDVDDNDIVDIVKEAASSKSVKTIYLNDNKIGMQIICIFLSRVPTLYLAGDIGALHISKLIKYSTNTLRSIELYR